ncbi:MAG: type II CRISPR-associated endonuclease Cas1 [Bacteroidaceae bacterium]|nr:type II CRISPR-associated endonuclease Cas1 [Bacteroidaceae bacterium]
MIKQSLMITSPVYLSLKNHQLVITFKDNDDSVTRPIEDIGFVVIEHPQVSISVPVLNELADNNVSVIFCDSKKMPKTMLMTLEGNTTLQESYKYQIDASAPTKKNIWKQLVESKIRNQSLLLNKEGKNGDVLKQYYMNVKSGDSDNREGAAAREYWGQLFEDGFKRDHNGLPPNNLLNYGYTILRAAVARALVGSGLYPAFGVFHRNRYNAFPLADDVMEPYRPFVDEIVYHLFYDGAINELDNQTKGKLLRVLFSDVKMGRVTRPLENALSLTTASLLKVFKGETDRLSLPMVT